MKMTHRDYYDISRFRPEHVEMLEKINTLGPKFAERAPQHDKEASFPTNRITRTWDAGFLNWSSPRNSVVAMVLPFMKYATIGAEVGKYCGATALTLTCTPHR